MRSKCSFQSGRDEATVTRFWRYVDKTDSCWLWTGGRNATGYGHFHIRTGEYARAHRFSYELHVGAIPAGMFVCHHCDNPSCVNPKHLFAGTGRDNILDCIRKGRYKQPHPRGSQVHTSVLSEEDVRAIKRLRSTGKSSGYLSKRFGTSKSNICQILNGATWRHIK